jgi:hypothetical protein
VIGMQALIWFGEYEGERGVVLAVARPKIGTTLVQLRTPNGKRIVPRAYVETY